MLDLPLLDLIRDNRWNAISDQLKGVLPEAINCEKLAEEMKSKIE